MDDPLHAIPFHSIGFRRVRWSSGSPILQGFWFMRVHSEPQRFKIFADGNDDIHRTESLVNSSIEMVQRAGLLKTSDCSVLSCVSQCKAALHL
jgi:hypothetical protein